MAEENFVAHVMGGMAENSNPPEIQGSENYSSEAGKMKWPGWPGENVYRMLVPVYKVGRIIGRKGEHIKKICEETKARIKILGGPPGATERAVLVSAKEEPDVPIPPALEGLLKVHKCILDVDSDPDHAPSGTGGMVHTRLLVVATQAGSFIGKQGATIKSIQDSCSCTIRVLGAESLPPFALPDDSVVEVQGEPVGVHKAVELIGTHLRKFLVDRSIISVFEMQMQNPSSLANQNTHLHETWGSLLGFPMNAGGGPGFIANPQHMPPPHPFDNYHGPVDVPPLDKQPRQDPPAYQIDQPLAVNKSTAPPQQSVITKVTQSMQIPISFADSVIGISGANISYIRRTSGASIVVQETRGVPGEMTVEIEGSASQVQAAQQLLQNFIADAASTTQKATTTAPTGQEFNFPSHGPAYVPPPTSLGVRAPTADYASIFGTKYGY